MQKQMVAMSMNLLIVNLQVYHLQVQMIFLKKKLKKIEKFNLTFIFVYIFIK